MLALALVMAPAARGDGPAAPTTVAPASGPPPWMPGGQPAAGDEWRRRQRARALARSAALFTGFGIGLFAVGIGVNVVALDVPQGVRTVVGTDGTRTSERVRAAANWAELAAGSSLMITGLAFVIVARLRALQARQLLGD